MNYTGITINKRIDVNKDLDAFNRVIGNKGKNKVFEILK